MMGQPSPLEALAFEWGDAFLLSYARDRWVALRRDTRRFLIADTLTGLEHLIQDDYRHHPVSRDCDPPRTADYLNLSEDGDVARDGGQELTHDAYLELLGDAGFHSTEVIGTPYGLSIIDAQPASTWTAA